MKIAYLINGLVGGLKGKNFERQDENFVPLIANYCKKTVDNFFCKGAQIDFYIFTWHTNHVSEFKQIFKPKEIVYQDQFIFPVPDFVENTSRTQAHISRWYGYLKVFESLERRISLENLKYDFVLNARFDICWNRDIVINDTNKLLLASYTTSKKLNEWYPVNKPLFNIDNWSPDLYGKAHVHETDLPDHIFGGDFKIMKDMSMIYDNLWYLHHTKKYGRGRMMSHHRLLPGMIKELKKEQKDINFMSYVDDTSRIADYDIFRYRNLKLNDLTI